MDMRMMRENFNYKRRKKRLKSRNEVRNRDCKNILTVVALKNWESSLSFYYVRKQAALILHYLLNYRDDKSIVLLFLCSKFGDFFYFQFIFVLQLKNVVIIIYKTPQHSQWCFISIVLSLIYLHSEHSKEEKQAEMAS